MKYLRSSAIRCVDYDPKTNQLWVIFTTGGAYLYGDISPEFYEGLLSAPSPGGFFNSARRNSKPSPRMRTKSGGIASGPNLAKSDGTART